MLSQTLNGVEKLTLSPLRVKIENVQGTSEPQQSLVGHPRATCFDELMRTRVFQQHYSFVTGLNACDFSFSAGYVLRGNPVGVPRSKNMMSSRYKVQHIRNPSVGTLNQSRLERS